MKKRAVSGIVLGLFLVSFLIVNLSFASASFNLGSGNSSYVELNYAPGENIRGWINLSLEDEPVNSLLTGFDTNISIKNFLELNSADYSCFPNDCETKYTSSNKQSSKSFSLNYGQTKLLGIRVTKPVSSIDNIIFNVSTNAGETCFLNPIKIDVLDDEETEYKAEQISTNSDCYIENPNGCYDENDAGEQTPLLSGSLYCEKINFPIGKGFQLGAEVTGTGNAQFEMSILNGDSCTINVNAGGQINCNVELETALEQETELYVCLKPINPNSYKIKYETENTCGYIEDSLEQQFPYDLPIFVKPLKYAGVNNFIFNDVLVGSDDYDSLKQEILGYINSRYQTCNSSSECIIPIRIYSGVNQNIIISNLDLKYQSAGTEQHMYDIYNLNETYALINMDFQILDLILGDFKVPLSSGVKKFALTLNNNEILSQNIKVLSVPVIKDIIPSRVPALVEKIFIVLLETNASNSNLTYTWDFGNGAIQTTTGNKIKYTYPALGNYNLKVIISNSYGNSSKTIQVTAISPKDYVNETIKDYNNKLNKIEIEINKLTEWVKKEIEKKFSVEDIRLDIKTQENKYDSAFTDEDYVEIMDALLKINVPDSFSISQTINPSVFFPLPPQINLNALESFGAGNIDGTAEEYANAVTNWFKSNLDARIESKTYSLHYDNRESNDLYSYIKLTLTPKTSLEESYISINGDPNQIIVNGEDKTKDFEEIAKGIIITELTSQKTFELLYPGKIQISSLPIYVSPLFKDLELGITPGICNSNEECEASLGETYKNCRSDCKPVGWTIFWLCSLIFIALVIYITLQEWYKRYYESNLFKDRNQLFNLINYMNNSLNQGIKKDRIFDSLKKLKWDIEQITYAWKRLNGKRTGMWEIPVFKILERKKIKQEIEKRGGVIYPYSSV